MKRIIEFCVLILISFGFTFCVKDDPTITGVNLIPEVVVSFPTPPPPPPPPLVYDSLTDQDGNIYRTIKIGSQTWMADNLRTTKYNDGTPIPNVTEWEEWVISPGAYCWYNNDEKKYGSVYGAFYNGNAVVTNKLCPVGWHVPSLSEWKTLINYLGGADVAGGKLKEEGWAHWRLPNLGATYRSGFDALPGGTHFKFFRWKLSSNSWIECTMDVPFNYIGNYSEWWSTPSDKNQGGALGFLGLQSKSEEVFGLGETGLFGREMKNGCYVRCVRGSSQQKDPH